MNKLTILSASAAIIAMAASCGNGQDVQDTGTKYKTMVTDTTTRTVTSSYSATIRGRQDIDIYPQVSGTIQKVCVKEGQKVNKGDVLFIIDQVPYKAALNTAQANVAAAEASVATAQLTYDSKVKLHQEQVVSQFELLSSKNSLLSAEANLAQAQAQLVNAQNNLSYTVVSSPADGVVGTIPFREGALVGPNIAKALTTISDNSQMYVYFSFNENTLLSLLRQYGSSDNAIKEMPGIRLRLSDGSFYDKQGRIESISGVIDRTTGTVSLRAVFDNQEGFLHSGASGSVVIPQTVNGCIVIPQGATTELQDKTIVYKVVDGKAVSAIITVSKSENGKEYIVTDGLGIGETIISEGAGLVKEGTAVNI